MNYKQIKYRRKKVQEYENKMYLRLLLTVLFVFTLSFGAYCLQNPHASIDNFIGPGAGVTWATMALIGNIEAKSDSETTGNQIAYQVWLLDVHQIDPDVAFPTPNANRELGSIPLKTGEYWHYFEAVNNSLEDKSTGEKGDVTTDMTNTFSFIMGGNQKELMDFITEFAGGSFLIVYRDVGEDVYKILGNNFKPMVLQNFERKNDKEGKYIPFTFQSKSFDMPYIYVGNLTTESPVTVAADATDLAITSNGTYQLTDGTASQATIATVSGLASADYGRTIDILGSGGTYPSIIADNTTFVLIDGTSWTANAGSRISFRILDDSTLVEIEGSRVQTA